MQIWTMKLTRSFSWCVHGHPFTPTSHSLLTSRFISLLHTPFFQYPPRTPSLPPLHGPQDLLQNPPSIMLPVGLSLSSYPLKLSQSSLLTFPITTTSIHTYLMSLSLSLSKAPLVPIFLTYPSPPVSLSKLIHTHLLHPAAANYPFSISTRSAVLWLMDLMVTWVSRLLKK